MFCPSRVSHHDQSAGIVDIMSLAFVAPFPWLVMVSRKFVGLARPQFCGSIHLGFYIVDGFDREAAVGFSWISIRLRFDSMTGVMVGPCSSARASGWDLHHHLERRG